MHVYNVLLYTAIVFIEYISSKANTEYHPPVSTYFKKQLYQSLRSMRVEYEERRVSPEFYNDP